MAKRNQDIPKPEKFNISKSGVLNELLKIDNDKDARERILIIENGFRTSMKTHVDGLPVEDSKLRKFSTSPFVLLIHCFKRGYNKISEIEKDILPAKEFSSMETSAGKMSEIITFPVYDWQIVESSMHTENSALDGKKIEKDVLKLATLKSGPRCLNDEMSENFADAIIANIKGWANEHKAKKVHFTYGVLYGTKKQSNKKDWHILRNLMEKLPDSCFSVLPKNRWDCTFQIDDIEITVDIKIGYDWWQYLGGQYGLLELVIALIRATIVPEKFESSDYVYTISDVKSIIDVSKVPEDFNISILQRSQLEWLYFILYHFCDEFEY